VESKVDQHRAALVGSPKSQVFRITDIAKAVVTCGHGNPFKLVTYIHFGLERWSIHQLENAAKSRRDYRTPESTAKCLSQTVDSNPPNFVIFIRIHLVFKLLGHRLDTLVLSSVTFILYLSVEI